MTCKRIVLFVLLAGSATEVLAQDFVWTLTTTNGERSANVALQRLKDDTLFILRNENFRDIVLLDSLATLERTDRKAILPAMLIGTVAGGVTGYSVKPTSKDQNEADIYGGVFGAVLGGVAGYLIGSILQTDEIVDLRDSSLLAKAEKLQRILK